MHGQQGGADIAAFLSGFDVDNDQPDDGPGPWFEARYGGECSNCFAGFTPGDIIRADGQGGYELRECCGDD